MSARVTRVRRVDALERRLAPSYAGPLFIMPGDEANRDRQITELEQQYGPLSRASGPLFVVLAPQLSERAAGKHSDRTGDQP